jgi:hypothetical protein
MGLISGMMIGVVVGVALMAGWSRVMRHRSRKRVAKVWFQDYYITTVGFGCWEQLTPTRGGALRVLMRFPFSVPSISSGGGHQGPRLP